MEVDEFKRIFIHYLKTWLVIDLISTIPFDIILLNTQLTQWGVLLKFLKLIKLFKLIKINQVKQNELEITKVKKYFKFN